MLTIRYKDAYRELIADADKAIHEHNKTVDAINDLGWDYKKFNQSMYQSYPDTYCSRLYTVPQPLFDIPKQGEQNE